MEAEIMSELRHIAFPYESNIYDINHFYDMTENGYYIGNLPEDNSNTNNGENKNDVENTSDSGYNVNIYQLTFEELIKYIPYFDDIDVIEECLSRAYDIYNSSDDLNLHYVGNMWFYKGVYENNKYYKNAAECFEINNEYFNTALSYYWLYNSYYDLTYAEQAFEFLINAVSNGESIENSTTTFKKLYIKTFEVGYNDYLSEFCNYVKDDVFLSTLNISNHISNGIILAEDNEIIDKFISMDKYSNCPKICILKAYYQFANDENISCENIYSLYIDNYDFFEPEDIINFAWILYESGEYVKSYDLANKLEPNDEMILLKTESYLQNKSFFLHIDEKQLYDDVTNALNSSEEESDVYNRLRLTQCILANSIGIDISYDGLTDICNDLFDGKSDVGMFITASLYSRDGNYAECIKQCDEILNRISQPNYFYNRVMFLKSDALINYASNIIDLNERMEYYNEAETILNEIRKDVGNDYITSLKKLSDLYKVMPEKDVEYQEINDLLNALQ